MSGSGGEQQGKLDLKTLVIAAFFCLLVIVLFEVYRSQEQNQLVRPLPGGPPAPVVPQLPDLAADLSEAKSLCEGHARAAKRQRHVPARQMARGRELYTDVKASYDGCITFLCVGLTRRFQEGDRQQIEARLRDASKKMGVFVEWSQSIQRPQYGELALLEAALGRLDAWLEAVKKENDEAIARLKSILEGCRLRTWEELD